MPTNNTVSKSEKASILLQNIDSLLGGESSVEIATTSKGVVNWKIKVYHVDPLKALEISNDIFEKCKQKYGGETS